MEALFTHNISCPAVIRTINNKQIAKIANGMTAASTAAESLPDDPDKQALIWVMIEEVKAGRVFAGGRPITSDTIPVVVKFYLPEGVLDNERRQIAAKYQTFIGVLMAIFGRSKILQLCHRIRASAESC